MKPNVFVISWKYSLIISAIILAGFLLLYMEIKKNQTFIQAITAGIRELRVLSINSNNKPQLLQNKKNLNIEKPRLNQNQPVNHIPSIQNNSSIKNNSSIQNKDLSTQNKSTNLCNTKINSEINSDKNSDKIINNLKSEILNYENEINQINKSLDIDYSSRSNDDIISNSSVNLKDLTNKVNENIENRTYSPKDSLQENSLHEDILNHLESEHELELEKKEVKESINLYDDEVKKNNSNNDINCISKENSLELNENYLESNLGNTDSGINENSSGNEINENNTLLEDNEINENNTLLEDNETNENNLQLNENINELTQENSESIENLDLKSNDNSQISSDSDLPKNLTHDKKSLLDFCMAKYSAKELIDLCKNNNLIIRGNKNMLVNRLISNNILNLSNLDSNTNSISVTN